MKADQQIIKNADLEKELVPIFPLFLKFKKKNFSDFTMRMNDLVIIMKSGSHDKMFLSFERFEIVSP